MITTQNKNRALRIAYKALHIFAGVAMVLNISMLSYIIAPQEAYACHGSLTVIKHVVGGDAISGDWTMHVNGPENYSFPGEEAPGWINTSIQGGDYVITESGGPDHYELTYSGDCNSEGELTLEHGENKTCTLTNTYVPYCGDGEINQDWEQCDDGNNVDGDGCSAECTIEPYCGDGEINQDWEQCDDGNNVDGDGCSAQCSLENGDLRIKKYNDLNGNGVKDGNDYYMTGWDFEVKQGSTIVASGTTGDDPQYSPYLVFTDLPLGSYDVVETQQSGWMNTEPGDGTLTKTITVTDGQMTNVWFGNKEMNYCGDGIKQWPNDYGQYEECDGNNGVGFNQQCTPECTLTDLSCDLEITKSVDKETASPGDTLNYTINYINNGDGICRGTGVKLYDELDSKVTYVNGSRSIQIHNDGEGDGYHATQGNDYNGVNKTLLYNVNRVSPGEYGEITFQATVNDWDECGEIEIPNRSKIWSQDIFVNNGYVWSNYVYTTVNKPCAGDLVVYKYIDADGTLDTVNDWIAKQGFTIEVWQNDQLVDTQVTGPDGSYSWLGLPVGTYLVKEIFEPNEYTALTETQYEVEIFAGQTTDVIFGNFENIDLKVYKYMDANGSLNDTDDWTAKEGWTIEVWKDDILIDTQQTNASGYYMWPNLGPGEYTVKEIFDNAQFMALTPTEYTFRVTSGNNVEKIFGNFEYGSISGYKFHDLNGNGIWDNGENALENWTINLWDESNDQPNSIIDTTLTDANGYYEFNGLTTGKYFVNEVVPAEWLQTSVPAVIGPLNVISGSEFTEQNFGNYKYGKITGTKYNDLNGNGIWDEGEPTLQGWTINLWNDGPTDIIDTTVTDENGNYSFGGLTTGNYYLNEEMMNGWLQTSEPAVLGPLTITSGAILTDNNFGNFQLGDINGQKFNDLNGNGIWDEGEPTLQGWTINLWKYIDDTLTKIDSTVTDVNGNYSFDNLTNDTYYLNEDQQAGWVQTYPGPLAVLGPIDIYSGTSVYGYNFGNFELGDINGQKFNDLNGNGAWDNGEPTLQGWTINLWTYINDTLTKIDSTLTDENGNYSFGNLTQGTYYLNEDQQAGWVQTYPGPLAVLGPIDIYSGTSVSGYDFGNFELIDLTVYKYMDENGSLENTDDWTPVESWTIEVWKNDVLIDTQLTNASGYYQWTNLGPGEYTVKEIFDNAEFTALTRTEYTFTVTSGNDVEKVFGNFELGTIAGYKFEDINNSGEWDYEGENGLAGWEINLWNDNAGQPGEIIDTTMTNEFGYFEFTGLMAGNYWLSETMQEGWYQYAPVGGVFGPIIVTSGYDNNQQESYFEFGNAEAVTLMLDKYNNQEVDQGGDGILETTETINYTIEWGVSGNSIATNVVLTDIIPAELNLDVASISDGGTWDESTRTITWDFGDQNPYASGFVTYSATLNVPVEDGTEIINIATISADNSDPQYLEAQSEVTVKSKPVLEIVKSVNKDWTNPGTTVIYTVTVTNVGTDAAINVMLSDFLPDGFTFETTGLATHEWLLDEMMEVGESQTVSYAVNVGEEVVAGFYDNLATTWADNHDEIDDVATVEVRVPVVEAEEADPVLTVVKTADKAFINAGDSVTYTVVVTNVGDAQAEAVAINVKLQDLLPAGFTFEDGSVTKTWDLGDMRQGESKTITYVAISNGSVLPGDYENLAVAWADNHGNVTDDANVEVRVPLVLGEELPTTGGSAMNFIYLFVAGLILVFSLYMLKMTSSKKETK